MSADLSKPCIECDATSGKRSVPGGLVLETRLFVAHALLAPCPLEGWLVLAPKRHARWWWELEAEELAELGPLAARLLVAQREALGAVHGYAFAIGDLLHHMHLHLVPRFENTPEHLKGRRAFDAPPGDALPEAVIAGAARRIAESLTRRV